MNTPLLSLCLLASVCVSTAQKVTTLIAKSSYTTNDVGTVTWIPGSTVLDIPKGEAMKVVTFNGVGMAQIGFWKDDVFFYIAAESMSASWPGNQIIEGPARFVVAVKPNLEPSWQSSAAGMVTLERWRVPKTTPIRN